MAKNQPSAAPPVATEPTVAPAAAEQSPAPEPSAAPVVAPVAAAAIKARVLMDCAFGKPDDVVELDAELLAQALASGQVDADPAAVAYAESL